MTVVGPSTGMNSGAPVESSGRYSPTVDHLYGAIIMPCGSSGRYRTELYSPDSITYSVPYSGILAGHHSPHGSPSRSYIVCVRVLTIGSSTVMVSVSVREESALSFALTVWSSSVIRTKASGKSCVPASPSVNV